MVFSIGVLTQKNIGNGVHHCRKMVQSSILKICYILGSNVICMCVCVHRILITIVVIIIIVIYIYRMWYYDILHVL